MKNLDLNKNGNIILCPVTGYETAFVADSSALLRIQFARSEDQLKNGNDALQFLLSPMIARQMGEDLLRMADRLSQNPPPGTIRS